MCSLSTNFTHVHNTSSSLSLSFFLPCSHLSSSPSPPPSYKTFSYTHAKTICVTTGLEMYLLEEPGGLLAGYTVEDNDLSLRIYQCPKI